MGEEQFLESDEPEITPEMVRAGVVELRAYNDDYESAEDAVRRIYQSMSESSSSNRNGSSSSKGASSPPKSRASASIRSAK